MILALAAAEAANWAAGCPYFGHLLPQLLHPNNCNGFAQRAKAFPGGDENGFNVLANWWVRGPDHNGL